VGEKFWDRDKVVDAVIAASAGGSGEGMVSESELEQIAREMGVDSSRVREILARGTGTIKSNDQINDVVGFPGPESFERVVDGDVSATQLSELIDRVGARYEDAGEPGLREAREFWEGWRYVTVEMTRREGDVRIWARSKVSYQRLMPLLTMALLPLLFSLIFLLRRPSAPVLIAVVVFAALLLLGWLVIGAQMRRNRVRILEKVDRLAESVRSEIRSGLGESTWVRDEESIEDRLR
jgi:hypothetical protein